MTAGTEGKNFTATEVTFQSEETPAPHLSPSGGPEEEIWTPAPLDLPVRDLTAEEKWPGEWHAICWMVAHGSSQRQIARELNYTETRISIICNKPEIQEKIESIRREFGAKSLNKRFEATAPKAAAFFARVIEGQEVVKPETRLQASQWMLEKVTGKPKQEITTDGGATILEVLKTLAAMKAEQSAAQAAAASEAPEEAKDVTPDPLKEWVSLNVPEGDL